MGPAAGGAEHHHIAGLYAHMLMVPLAEQLSHQEVRDILRRAGDDRSIEDVCDVTSWNSYQQFKRLLQEVKVTLESAARPGRRDLGAIMMANPELAETTQAFGSPGSVLASGTDRNPLVPIRRYETTEVSANEWTIRERFTEGYPPFPEYCEFVAGQYAMIPMFFGLPPGEVTEEECQCLGDASCTFRLRWQQADDDTSRADFFELKTQLLEARLEQLQGIIASLSSSEQPDDVLQGIVESSVRAVGASGALLTLESRGRFLRRNYSKGLTDEEVNSITNGLQAMDSESQEVLAVDVASARRRYGQLAVDGGGGVFTSHSRGILDTYARLAAAALDAADALEEARVLLELSTSLAEIVGTDEMATKVARAVPALIDCDRVAVFIDDDSLRGERREGFRIAASVGYSDEALRLIESRYFTPGTSDVVSENGLVESSFSHVGTLANLSAPIVAGGNTIGYVIAGVTSRPERLAITPALIDQLKGLAAQAAVAISNARLVDQIRFQAVHDALTGLPNRALILDRANHMLARSRRDNSPVAALFIDLDGFKDVNDTLGHAVGDQLLEAAATRLIASMRENDSVGRLGGDEFVVLVDGATIEVAPELVAERLLEALRRPFELPNAPCGSLTLTASIGIARGVRPSATELLRDADIALYEAKERGKDCFVVFEPEMHTAVQDRHLLDLDLREALPRRQFFLVYQPIFDLRSGHTVGVEALLRWMHPERGVVQPDCFIPALEDSGLIVDVGRWVLEEACLQGATWHAAGHGINVSVNVSARQLETDGFLEDLRSVLHTSGFEASYLTIEITETAIMKQVSVVIPRLNALKASGVRIAIDDFGTGYSSLAYLQQFPVDTVKIDRSFVSSMVSSPQSKALIHTLVQLGKSLGLETLAEGIEIDEQYALLRSEECDSGQGYLVSMPLEAEVVEAFLRLEPHRDRLSTDLAGEPT